MGWNRGNIVLILKRYGNTFDKKKKKKQNHSTLKGKLEGSQQENKQTENFEEKGICEELPKQMLAIMSYGMYYFRGFCLLPIILSYTCMCFYHYHGMLILNYWTRYCHPSCIGIKQVIFFLEKACFMGSQVTHSAAEFSRNKF